MGTPITFYTCIDLPKDGNLGFGAAAYLIGKQLDSEFCARGSDKARVICSFIAGLSKDARQRIGNAIFATEDVENLEATGIATTGKRKRDSTDPKSSDGMLWELFRGFYANFHSSEAFEAAQPQPDKSPTS
jgi:hypothetical protein